MSGMTQFVAPSGQPGSQGTPHACPEQGEGDTGHEAGHDSTQVFVSGSQYPMIDGAPQLLAPASEGQRSIVQVSPQTAFAHTGAGGSSVPPRSTLWPQAIITNGRLAPRSVAAKVP